MSRRGRTALAGPAERRGRRPRRLLAAARAALAFLGAVAAACGTGTEHPRFRAAGGELADHEHRELGSPAGGAARRGAGAARGAGRGRGATARPPRPPQALQVAAGGAGTAYSSLSAALEAAVPGDTLRVGAGVYRERVAVDVPVVILGEEGAVVDGGGAGAVVTVQAPGTELRGLTIRGSGSDLSREDAGVLVEGADSVRIEGCRLEEVLFGVYVKGSADVQVRGNHIVGKPLPVPRRGDGIRLWYSRRGRIEGNRVERTRDVVIWFSDGVVVRGNRVTDGRYGLHYMYSDANLFEENVFLRNQVGAFLMYSEGISFRRNVFGESAGATGVGLGLKDADRILAQENLLARNAVGIYMDNSPRSEAAVNRFLGNVIALNEVGVSLLPSVHANEFRGNAFLGNVRTVEVSGGGTALRNGWRGNHWDEYVGFDADGDGRGDTPFVLERLSDDLLARRPALRLYELSPALLVLNTLARVFPLLQPAALVVDSLPRLSWEAAWLAALPEQQAVVER